MPTINAAGTNRYNLAGKVVMKKSSMKRFVVVVLALSIIIMMVYFSPFGTIISASFRINYATLLIRNNTAAFLREMDLIFKDSATAEVVYPIEIYERDYTPLLKRLRPEYVVIRQGPYGEYFYIKINSGFRNSAIYVALNNAKGKDVASSRSSEINDRVSYTDE